MNMLTSSQEVPVIQEVLVCHCDSKYKTVGVKVDGGNVVLDWFCKRCKVNKQVAMVMKPRELKRVA